MTTKVTINRLATGVPGLDEVLGGGLPEFSFNLIAGPPGCGKTTLAHQMMFALATAQRPALYFTVLGEPPLKMLRYQQQFDFFDNEAINHRVRFINLSEDAMTGELDRVLRRIVDEVTLHSPGAGVRRLVPLHGLRIDDRRQPAKQAAAVRAAARDDDDELAGHHLPARRILQRR